MSRINRMTADGGPAIFLVGFMACGKSSVGPALASRLGRGFIDLDQMIEDRAGCTIGELIARDGEENFRRLETDALREAAGSAAVIAPGGGAITLDENRRIMEESGVTIWLDAAFELCWRRIRQDATVRPLAPDEATARNHYEMRLPLYRQADLHIPIDAEMSPEEISEKVLGKLII